MPEELLNDVKFAADFATTLYLLVCELLGLGELAEVDEMALLAHDEHVLGVLLRQQ